MHCIPARFHALTWLALAAALASCALSAAELVSVSLSGSSQASQESRYPVISFDGRYVAFQSTASNLVSGDTNGFRDVFLRDMVRKTTIRVSLNPAGGIQGDGDTLAPSISGDGKRIVFSSFADSFLPGSRYQTCYLRDLRSDSLSIIDLRSDNGQPGEWCQDASIDLSGQRVAFQARASNLVPGDSNGWSDVFVRDLAGGPPRRINLGPGGVEANGESTNVRISGDGSQVLFASEASNLVAGDSNARNDIFMAPAAGGAVTRINVGTGGVQANGHSDYVAALNFDGTITAFTSDSSSLEGWADVIESSVYVRLPTLDQTYLLSQAMPGAPARDGFSMGPDLSATGQYLVFWSTDDLLDDAIQTGGIYVIDMIKGLIARVDVSQVDPSRTFGGIDPRISGDGTSIVWISNFDNLVPNDDNGSWDVFYARNPLHPLIHRASFED
jgi:Tol biopolymer transport system component